MTGRVVTFGFDDALFNAGQRSPISWSEEFATNGHMLISGKSGTGKTFTLRRIIGQLIRPLPGRQPPRIHVFDVHDDISFDGESRIHFSEASPYGINPLRLSSDPRYGGVRKCVESFVDMINESSSQLGPRQMATLKNVLYDLFRERGFLAHDSATWVVDDDGDQKPDEQGRIFLDVPFEDKDLAKATAKAEKVTFAWCQESKSWWCSEHVGGLQRWETRITGRRPPTVQDLHRFLMDRLRQMQIGASGKCVRALDVHNNKVQAWHKLCAKVHRTGAGSEELEALQQEIHDGAQALVETFTDYVYSIDSGREIDAVLRFDSEETLKSLVDRIGNLMGSGIFGRRRLDFEDDAPVWAYSIAPLRDSEQQFFVWTCLRQIFERAKELGQVSGASEVREVIVLDEAHKFFTPKDINILDILSREARKFGIALIAASQAPQHFSEDFLGNVGTKILLGLDERYHDQVIRKMRIDRETLNCVVAGKIAAIQVSDKRDMKHGFRRTRVGN